MTSTADIVVAYIEEVWNGGEIGRVPAFIHDAYAVKGSVVGPDWVADNVTSFRRAFPDLTMTIEALVASDVTAAGLLRLRGTHAASWRGIEATGRTVEYHEAAFWTIQDGKIIAARFVADTLGVRVQLGQVPASAWTGATLIER